MRHVSLETCPFYFDGTTICRTIARIAGGNAAGLHLTGRFRNNTEAGSRPWFYCDEGPWTGSEDSFRIFSDEYDRGKREGDIEEALFLTQEDIPGMPPSVKLLVCHPLVCKNNMLGWIAVGFPAIPARDRDERRKSVMAIGHLLTSYLIFQSEPDRSAARSREAGIFRALMAPDLSEPAVAVFSREAGPLLTSPRWEKLLDHPVPVFSPASIIREWAPEWNRALNDETVQGQWIAAGNNARFLHFTMVPWKDDQEEIGGVIIVSETFDRESEEETGPESDPLGRILSFEDERRHLARKLHDELCQSLSAALFNLELLHHPQEAVGEDQVLDRTRRLVNDAILELREISQQLYPSVIDDFGLATAMKVLCSRLSRTSGKQIGFQAFQIDRAMPDFYQITLFRICKDALECMIRYAAAGTINVRLFQRSTSVFLHIRNEDSSGLHSGRIPEQNPLLEKYLAGIREQTVLYKGDFHMDFQTEDRTEFIIQFPLNTCLKVLQDKSYETN